MTSNETASETMPHQEINSVSNTSDNQSKCTVLTPVIAAELDFRKEVEVNSNIEYSKHIESDLSKTSLNGHLSEPDEKDVVHSHDSQSSEEHETQQMEHTSETNNDQVSVNGSNVPLEVEESSANLVGDLTCQGEIQRSVNVQNAVTLSQTQVTDLLTQALQESAIPSDFHLFLVQQPDGETTILQGQPLILQQLVLPQGVDGTTPSLAGQLILASPQLLQIDPSALNQVQPENHGIFGTDPLPENPTLQMVQNAAQEGHTCTTCGKTLKLRRSLNRHMRDVHGKDKTERQSIKKEVQHKSQIPVNNGLDPVNQQQQPQKPCKTYTCTRCGVTVKSSWSLTRHTRNVHGEGKIACLNQGCPLLFTAKQAMIRHYGECRAREDELIQARYTQDMEQAYQQHSDAEAYQNDTGSHDQMSAEEENNMSDSNYEETTEVMELKPVVEAGTE